MGQAINRLSARRVQTIAQPGRHADGGGLYLVVDANGSKRWVFLFKRGKKTSEMGLGGLASVPLARAREVASECRAQVAAGMNPIEHRRQARAKDAGVPNFGDFADQFMAEMSPQWENKKHIDQWKMTLTHYAAPLRGKLVSEIGTNDVLAVLKPIWTKKPETAARLRGRIERVLDAAKVKGYRSGENPARWRGHLDHVLPKRSKLGRGHHAAMPYQDVPAFLGRLRESPSMAALALEFTVLTCARTNETLGAELDEFDFKARVWTVPPERMKKRREHRVPLVDRAVEIIRTVTSTSGGEPASLFVFRGNVPGKSLSNMSMEMVLRRMEITDATVHGFRSSFRDWAGNETNFPREVAEAALAHAVGDATEQAYRRSDALDKRRGLMDAWAMYCASAREGETSAETPIPQMLAAE
jgi:integrase